MSCNQLFSTYCPPVLSYPWRSDLGFLIMTVIADIRVPLSVLDQFNTKAAPDEFLLGKIKIVFKIGIGLA